MAFHAGQSFVFGEQPSATKWNYLWDNDYALANGTGISNDAITKDHIKDGDVLPYHLLAGGASSWAWQTWAPTYSNLTVGNGTVTAKYSKTGKTINYRWIFQLGSTSSIGSNPSITLPEAAINGYSGGATPEQANIGVCKFLDSGIANISGLCAMDGTTSFRPQCQGAGGTYVINAGLSATIPVTWGTGDALFAVGAYEAA